MHQQTLTNIFTLFFFNTGSSRQQAPVCSYLCCAGCCGLGPCQGGLAPPPGSAGRCSSAPCQRRSTCPRCVCRQTWPTLKDYTFPICTQSELDAPRGLGKHRIYRNTRTESEWWLTDPSLRLAAGRRTGTSPSPSSRLQPKGSWPRGMWLKDLRSSKKRRWKRIKLIKT